MQNFILNYYILFYYILVLFLWVYFEIQTSNNVTLFYLEMIPYLYTIVVIVFLTTAYSIYILKCYLSYLDIKNNLKYLFIVIILFSIFILITTFLNYQPIRIINSYNLIISLIALLVLNFIGGFNLIKNNYNQPLRTLGYAMCVSTFFFPLWPLVISFFLYRVFAKI